LFCEYFAIRLARYTSPHNDATYEEIVDDLANPNVEYERHPCMKRGCMNIYKDLDDYTPPILNWKAW